MSKWVSVAYTMGVDCPFTMSVKVGRYKPIPWWHRLWLWVCRKPRPILWSEVTNPINTSGVVYVTLPDDPPNDAGAPVMPAPKPGGGAGSANQHKDGAD